MAVAIVFLWGAGAALRKRARQVRDSPAFKAALGIVHPLVFAAHGTPRAIKRFQNRMRYLAVRINPPPPEVDPVDRLLYRLGNWLVGRKWLKHSWVPESRVAPVTTTLLSEPKLILLGAAEAFDPGLQEAEPESFHEWIEASPTPTMSGERSRQWSTIRRAFKADDICGTHWPTEADIRHYRGIIASVESTTAHAEESGEAAGPPPESESQDLDSAAE